MESGGYAIGNTQRGNYADSIRPGFVSPRKKEKRYNKNEIRYNMLDWLLSIKILETFAEENILQR